MVFVQYKVEVECQPLAPSLESKFAPEPQFPTTPDAMLIRHLHLSGVLPP